MPSSIHWLLYWVHVLAVSSMLLVSWAISSAMTIGPPLQIGTITSSTLSEISGIVESRAVPNTFWVHNDSGDIARFLAINHQGNLLGGFPLAGAASGDWEDLAIGPKPGGGNYLYLGDIGDNALVRPYITVYRTAEPESTNSATIAAANYSTARLQYPGGARRNAESLIVDPLTNDLFILTKNTTGTEIYSAPASAFQDSTVALTTTTMTSWGPLGEFLRSATAADISPNGRHILVRSRTAGFLFERAIGQSIADALGGAGVSFTLAIESQGEAIGWAADGSGFFTTSEWNGLPSAPIHFYAFAPTPPPLPGDFNEDQTVDGEVVEDVK